MNIKIFKKDNQIKNVWSGGTSTQFLIYPFEGSLAERNFILRISSATIETETSVFSDFSGFTRILMILEGSLQLRHETDQSITLNQFDQYQFDGGRETRTQGFVKDFNVITRTAARGMVSGIKKVSLTKIETSSPIKINPNELLAVYCYLGSAIIKNEEINSGDLFFADEILCNETIQVNTSSGSVLLVVKAELVK